MIEPSLSLPPAIAHQRLRFAPGDVLFRPEQPCPGFVLVRSGTIRVSLTAENGREIVLYRVRRGEICLQTFACLAEGRPYSADGIAETALEIDIVSNADFTALIIGDSGFRAQLFAAVAHRFGDLEQLVEDVALTGFEARLARILLRLADSNGCVAATHEQIAVEMGSGRAVVSRQLGRFARAGLVRLARGHLEICAHARLVALCHEAG